MSRGSFGDHVKTALMGLFCIVRLKKSYIFKPDIYLRFKILACRLPLNGPKP